MMQGHFEAGSLGAHTYRWTFTPTYKGEPAIVLPVHEQGRLLDFLAIARHDYRVWGCVTGAGQYLGQFGAPLSVHGTPYSWLMSNCDGVLPLAKAFFPPMQFAPSIVAQDGDHAWEIAHQAFIYPAERFDLDCYAAEQVAFDRISEATTDGLRLRTCRHFLSCLTFYSRLIPTAQYLGFLRDAKAQGFHFRDAESFTNNDAAVSNIEGQGNEIGNSSHDTHSRILTSMIMFLFCSRVNSKPCVLI
jgi:hypothetical protein